MSIQYQKDTETKIDIIEPGMWKVILLNDNYSTFEFVTYVLVNIFGKSEHEAIEITMNVHEKGSGVAGIYAKDIAETKIIQVHETAGLNNYPLTCKLEKE